MSLSGSFALAVSDFAVGEGVYTAEHLVKLAKRLGYPALAAWDPGLHGLPRLREEIAFRKAELDLFVGARFSWRGHGFGALPESREGYGELGRLLTDQAFGLEGELPRGCTILAERLEGFEALAGNGLEVALLGHPARYGEARTILDRGGSVVGPQVLRFARPEGFELHRLKRAITARTTLPRAEPLWDPSEGALPRSLWESRFPMAEPAIARATEALQERLSGWSLSWGEWVNPVPLGLEGRDLDEALREVVLAGLARRRLPVEGAVAARLAHELELVRRKKFAGYFLVVKDLVQPDDLALSETCGRGSGAASLVSYALGITNVDPLATNLVFERFLTDARKDPPDLDVDFPWDERDGVILRAFARYGGGGDPARPYPQRVAMVANHVFFKPRSALRSVALAFGRPEAELTSMTTRLQRWGWEDPARLEGRLERTSRGAPPLPRAWEEIQRLALALEGHFHQLSVHPGGTILTPGPLWAHVPFQPAPAKEGVAITQWDKDGVEAYGLVKIDLLGNRSLAVIRDATRLLGEQVPFDLGRVSREDPATQELLAAGDSMGVFYVESPATRQLQQRVGKGDFETLVIHSSLIRPAAYHWVDTYVRRVRGEEAYVPSHPAFASLLSDSHGVLIYQEDVSHVAQALAGWSYDEGDALRKLLGKPDCARKLPGFEARFREGCAARGIPESVVDEAWDMIRTFRGYSFCKPHSASYAQVSFQSAWIKRHHPAVFFACVINNHGGFYPAIAYLGDARRHKLVVRGPDVNRSELGFAPEGEGAIRAGLLDLKGAVREETEAVRADREARGPFADSRDLQARVRLSLPTLEALAAAGAMDLWAPDGDRTRLFWEPLGGVPPRVRPRPTDPFDRADLEMEVLGFTLELHPAALARYRHGGGPDRAADVARKGRDLRLWALVVAHKTVLTEKGEPMQFVTFEDETGLCEAVAFPDAFRRRRRPFRTGDIVPVRGRAVRQDGLALLEVR